MLAEKPKSIQTDTFEGKSIWFLQKEFLPLQNNTGQGEVTGLYGYDLTFKGSNRWCRVGKRISQK